MRALNTHLGVAKHLLVGLLRARLAIYMNHKVMPRLPQLFDEPFYLIRLFMDQQQIRELDVFGIF